MTKLLIHSAFLVFVAATQAEVPWHHPLYLANQGYWPVRMPLEIENSSNDALVGEPIETPVGALAETPVISLRVCREDGTELLFELRDGTGRAKRDGRLSFDDKLILPVECPARAKCAIYVYAGNEHASAVPDFLTCGFSNGEFELGSQGPAGWQQSNSDTQHVLSWVINEGREKSRCAKAEVAAGAVPSWVQWQQPNIPVTAGRTYRLTGWVRADRVVGSAGWYVHVNGERPQLMNKTLNAGSGTYDWTSISTEFTVPEGGTTATVGTVLHGTGRAWFDSAQLLDLSRAVTARVAAGVVERMDLTVHSPGATRALSSDWPGSCQILVRNFANQPRDAALVRFNLRAAIARLPAVPRNVSVRIEDEQGVLPVSCRTGSNGELLFATDLAPRTQRQFTIRFSAASDPGRDVGEREYEQLLDHRVNLVRNGSFETGESQPDDWLRPAMAGVRSGVADSPRFGKRCLELTVPHNVKADWIGWHSRPIPVRAGASYFLSGWLKASDVRGTATMHAHFHNAASGLTQSGAMVSTHPSVSGDSGWVNTTALLHAPPDATTLVLHLTTNATGTLRHDAVLLAEVLTAQLHEMHTLAEDSGASPLNVWQVNPLVKVFPETPAGVPVTDLQVELARNEFEPVQLALRGTVGIKPRELQIHVTDLKDNAGHALPAVKVERVGFVPIDHPSGYYRSDVTEWCRKVPQGEGSTDGWAGWWPDPLIPSGSFRMAAGETQSIWLTVHAPEEAVAGDYHGSVSALCSGEPITSLPLHVRVLPFALPRNTRLRAILDFRFGPGGTFGSGAESLADRQRWLRFMAEHRLGIDGCRPPKFDYANGAVTMDTSEFDEDATFCFDELGMNVSYTPWFFYMFGWAYPPKKLFGFEPFSPEWETAFRQAYGLFSKHLRAKGWHDRFVYYISDEPHFDHEYVVKQMQQLCTLIHDVDPQIPIYSSTWRHCPAWNDSLDIWGVGQYGCFPVNQMEQRLRAGKQIWFTCDGQMATDTPLLATERMLPYYCWKYGATGFEFWGLAWWTYDPWQRGWHTFIRQSDDGKQHYWVRYPDGDGYLTYPGRSLGLNGPVSTIRLEQVREGLEDYEAMVLLSQLSEQARAHGRATAPAERALNMARELVTIPNAGGLRSTEILPDAERIPYIRRAINAAIVELSHKAGNQVE